MAATAPSRRRVALCLFGLPRALALTADALSEHLIAPLADRTDLVVLAHANSDLGEGVSGADLAARFPLDEFETDPADACLDRWAFDRLCRHGDYWQNGHASLRRLVHQLHSLHRVTDMARRTGAEQVLFARSDLLYHNNLGPVLPQLLAESRDRVHLPAWQHWKGGLNDRFAYCTGRDAAAVYGGRAEQALAYCRRTGQPLQSERLVAYVLWTAGLTWRPLPLCASRVRVDGTRVAEDFRPHPLRSARQKTRLRLHWLGRGIWPGRSAAH